MLPLSVLQLQKKFDYTIDVASFIQLEAQPVSLADLNLPASMHLFVSYKCPYCNEIHYLLLPDQEAVDVFVGGVEELNLSEVAWYTGFATHPVNIPIRVAAMLITLDTLLDADTAVVRVSITDGLPTLEGEDDVVAGFERFLREQLGYTGEDSEADDNNGGYVQ